MLGAPVTEGLGLPFGHGREFLDLIDVASPSAGANATFTVRGDWAVRVLAAIANLTTDANAANRLPSLDFIDARGVTRVRNVPAAVVTANTSNQAVLWMYNLAQWDVAANAPLLVPVMPLFLDPGFTVQFTLTNKQAGDQWSGLSLVVEKWPTGYRGEHTGTVSE